jgi:superfamily II helicase
MTDEVRYKLALDGTGLIEVCDRCNQFIFNKRWMGMSFVTYEGSIVCNDCRGEILKEKVLTLSQTVVNCPQ